MPFYRYECEDCGTQFRVLQQSGKDAPGPCPSCGAERAKRMLPRIGVIYKGSGYYNTDYRSKGSTKKRTNGKSSTEATSAASQPEG